MKKIMGKAICMAILLIPTGIQAEEEKDTAKVIISFDLTAEDRFTYEVKVSEGGYLYDGSQRITNGIVAYELRVGESKKFRISPDRGYEVKEIIVNENKLDVNIESITIAGVSAKSNLEVRYGRIEEELPDKEEPNKPTIPDNTNKPEKPEGKPNDVDSQGNINKPGETGGIDRGNNIGKENKENRISSFIPITGDMLKLSEYVCLMLIVLYRLYVSRRGISAYIRVNDIAISKDIEERKNKNFEGGKEI